MSQPVIVLHRTCRVCSGDLQEVLNLGSLRLNAFPQHPWEIDQAIKVPHILAVCERCRLAQLTHTVPQDWLYRQYWYQSSVNETMRTELQSIVREAVARVEVNQHDWVLDIGANDGTLLSNYAGMDLQRVAVEPALNLHDQLNQHCEVLIGDYFPTSALDNLAGKFKVISAIACAYDLEAPVAFFEKIAQLLHPEGVAIIQFQDLGQQIDAAAFDNICIEHLEYYTLWSLLGIVARAGLRITRCAPTPINGGSLRVELRRGDAPRMDPGVGVVEQFAREAQQGLATHQLRTSLAPFAQFRRQVDRVKQQILGTLDAAWRAGSIVDCEGASTKGNITLQVLQLGPSTIRQAIDRDPRKHGRLTVTGVPIVSEEVGLRDPADLKLVLAWQFRDSILGRNAEYLRRGGSLCFPLPRVEMYRAAGVVGPMRGAGV